MPSCDQFFVSLHDIEVEQAAQPIDDLLSDVTGQALARGLVEVALDCAVRMLNGAIFMKPVDYERRNVALLHPLCGVLGNVQHACRILDHCVHLSPLFLLLALVHVHDVLVQFVPDNFQLPTGKRFPDVQDQEFHRQFEHIRQFAHDFFVFKVPFLKV